MSGVLRSSTSREEPEQETEDQVLQGDQEPVLVTHRMGEKTKAETVLWSPAFGIPGRWQGCWLATGPAGLGVPWQKQEGG